MTNGVTYFKLKSPYEGDFTKNCALTGAEIDNNFFTLEGRDIKDLSVEDNDIVLTLLNGNKIKAKDAFGSFVVNVGFNEESGTLKVFYQDGRIEELTGFVKSDDNATCNSKVYVDETLVGNGTSSKPIGISSTNKTGQYKPVDGIIESVNMGCKDMVCDCHNNIKSPKPGDRYIVMEKIGSYGFLYNYKDATQIACELKKANSKWRIPTKEDWDDMLNAVEPCECDRTHNKGVPNRYLGKWAGKLLKSKYFWKKDGKCGCGDGIDPEYFNDGCECHDNPCKPTYCGEMSDVIYLTKDSDASGVDKYGFGILPAGYADDAGNILFFGERAAFWTGTNMHFTNVFEKRFEYDKSNVYQDVIPGQNYLSIRLVKDYDGNNYNEAEDILGQTYPTVLMPSVSNGKSIWTAVNVSFTGKQYKELIPNYGQDMTFVTAYYIDEWDGSKWVRNEIKEGDSVVVKTTPSGKLDVEYRIVDGKLVSISSQIYEDVIDSINPMLEELGEKLTNEINRSKVADAEFDVRLKELNEKIEANENKSEELQSSIDNVNGRVDKIDEKLNEVDSKIEEVNQAVKDVDTKLNDFVTETNVKFETLEDEIATERKERQDAIDEVKEQIEDLTDETNEKFESVENKLTALDNNLHIQEGSVFNAESGMLTIKSKGGENDIQVQFILNMGQF